MADYRIDLGVGLNQSQLNTVKQILESIENQQRKVVYDVDFEIRNLDKLTRVGKEIEEIQTQLKGKSKNAIPIDTKNVETSLTNIHESIKKLQSAFGKVDSKKGVQSLLTTVNKIRAALEGVTKQFGELNTNLNNLTKKDFSINMDLSFASGKKTPEQLTSELRMLKAEAEEYEKHFQTIFPVKNNTLKGKTNERAIDKLMMEYGTAEQRQYNLSLGSQMYGGGSIQKQVSAYKEYIRLIKQVASVGGLEWAATNKVQSRLAESGDLVKVRNEANETQKQLQELFSGGINAEHLHATLDEIKRDLSDISKILKDLSANGSFNGLADSFNNISKSVEELIQNCVNAKTAINDSVGNVGKSVGQSGGETAIKETSNELTKLKKLAHQIGQLDFKIVKSDYKNEVSQVKEFERQLELLKIQYRETVNSIEAQGIDINSEDITKEFAEARNKIAEFEAKIADTKRKLAEDIKTNIGTNIFKDINKVHSDFNNLSIQTNELKQKLDLLDSIKVDLDTAAANNDIEGLIKANERYEIVLKDVKTQLDINKRAERDANSGEALTLGKESAMLKLENAFGDGSEAARRFAAEINRIQREIDECGDIRGLQNLNKQIDNLISKSNAANYSTTTFGQRLKKQWQQYTSYFSVASLFMYAEQGLRSMFEQVKLIDSAMTELKKVTDETDESYNKFLSNAATRSREIGTTIDGLVSSTADFARLGYGFEDAQGLAEVANIYAVVGDEIEGVEGATESLISTMAAFKDEMNGMSNTDFAMSIIDKFNEIGNNFAISSGGIGEALERSASSLMAANNTIDESIALITAANTVVQDPTQVGTAFKTISMRIRGAKTELEEAGLETEGMVDSTAKLRQEILALSGVDIMENANEFKSTYAIMDELAAKWKDLTDIQQASVTELIAGKRQGNIVSSLMTNFDTARDALETSLNSSGSAMREHEKWQQSLEAQINKLKASWQSLSQAFLSSDFLKGAFDLVIKLADGITLLIDKVGVLPTFFTGFTIFKSFGNKGLFKTFNNDLDGFTNKVGIANKSFAELMNAFSSANTGGFQGFISGLKSMGDALANPLSQSDLSAIESYNKLIDDGIDGQIAFAQTMNGTSNAAQNLVQSANGSKVALNGMKTATVGAKVGLIGAKVAAVAFNAALTMGISLLIDFAISGIMKLVNAKKELAEKVEELTSKFKEQSEELKKLKNDYDTSNESSMISKYEKLSKGVDNLGRNVSLTADEYLEYQSIVNKIAEQIPSLVTGYDSQGNALLSVKGNVEELTAAYEKLIHTQNQEILTNTKDIEKDFENTIKKADNQGIVTFWNRGLETDTIEALESLQKGASAKELSLSYGKRFIGLNELEIKNALEDAGVDVSDLPNDFVLSQGLQKHKDAVWEKLEEVYKEDPSKIKGIIDNYYEQFAEAIEEQKTIAQAKLSEAFDIGSTISGLNYGNISEDLQAVAYQVVNNLDLDFFKELQNSGKTVEQWTTEMLDELNTIGDTDSNQISAAFDLQTKFNGGEISFGEYIGGLENVNKLIEDLNLKDEVKSQLKLSLGLSEDGLVEEYEVLKNKILRQTIIPNQNGEIDKFLDSLSVEEVDVLTNIIPDIDEEDGLKDIQAAIDRMMAVQGLTFDLNLEVEAVGIEALNTAMAESVSGAGLSAESIAALKARYSDLESEGYNLSAMFEETSNGIHINREAFRELEKAYAQGKQAEITEDLTALKKEYDLVTQEIEGCNDASERASLYVQRDAILQQINDAATLASQYEGLTSAYNDWLAAEEAGQERDMYEKLIEGFENIDDEISRGWLDDGTIEFLELLSGKDLTAASIKELKEAYKDLDETIGNSKYSVRDFFTVNEDGDSTNTGVYNFLETIESFDKFKDVIKKKDGRITGFNFEIVAEKDEKGNVIKNGDQVIAEALGISEELVQIMLRAADDAGFVINLEGAYTQLADLKTEAEAARDSLISLKNSGLKELKDTDVNFNLNAEGQDLVDEQAKAIELLKKFRKDDGIINLEMTGAQEALDIAEYLTLRLDDLTEPRFMQVDASTLAEELQTPFEKMQKIGELLKEKNLETLIGDPKVIAETESEITTIAEELAGLPEETKTKIGIEKDWTSEEIVEAIETGEIEIPAELKLDVQMSDDLKDLRLMMMNQLGLASDEEVKLKVGFDIDESVVNELTEDEKKVVVKYITENEEEFKKLTDGEKKAVIKIITDGTDVESWEPEQKEALVKYIVDGGSVENWTPEQKLAFAKYLVDGGDVEGWSPEAKNAFVKYLVDGGDPEKFDPENKESWVVYKVDDTEPVAYEPPAKEMSIWARFKGWLNGFTSDYAISEVNGTANVNGTAFKQGSWGTQNSGTALVGELGREVLVRDGRYYTIGDSGAEFIKYKKGDIIFNHIQSEQLFKNGRVTAGGGRAKALVNGTAFAQGTAFVGGSGGSDGGLGKITEDVSAIRKETEKGSGSKGSDSDGEKNKDGKAVGDKSKSGSSSSSEKEFEETIDWVETALSRIEREVDKLDKKANNVYKSWSERNSALASEINKVGDEIALQQSAYNRYIQEANSVGLSGSWAEKVRNGTIDISIIKDEALAEKIKDYQSWYEKALACQDAIEDLREQESKLYAQRFENIQTQYDGILQGYEHTEAMLNEYISQAEARGHIVSKEYYNALIANEKQNINTLKKEQSALIAERDKAVADGKIVKGSEAWLEQCAAIDEVTQSIEESNTALLEFSNSIRELNWEKFDLIQERISNVTSEAEFLIELMSNKDLFDDNGKLTAQGAATMGLHAQNYNVAMYQSDDYGKEIANLDKQIAKDPYDQELINRRRELVELQRESILEAENQKNAIRDLVEEGINLELDALQERIDLHNEEINSMKDLYDYQKNVEEQTKNIASLRKQLGAYEGFDDEETRAKVQELKVSLEEAESDLFETEYDKFINDQTVLLDNLFLEYENILNSRIDDTNLLIQQVIDGINASMGAEGVIDTALGAEGAIAKALGSSASTIGETLKTEVGAVGTKLSAAMSNIWLNDGSGKAILDLYGKDFQNKQTTTNATLNSIKTDVAAMVDDVDKDAQKKVTANKTTTSAQKNPTTNTLSSTKPATNTNKSSGDGKAKVGDKVKFVSGKYYYDSQGKQPLGAKNLGKEVYITKINTAKWATHPYHISTGKTLGSGDLGWLKLNQLSGYATGKKNISDSQYAWTQEKGQEFIVRPSDGAILTPVAKGDSVLNATATGNIWKMANNPTEFIKNNLGLDNANIPNGANVNNTYHQTIDSVVLNMPNVKNYDEMLAQMQKDKNFERLVLAMSIDRLAGKSGLAKGKSIR